MDSEVNVTLATATAAAWAWTTRRVLAKDKTRKEKKDLPPRL
jgi:hypothetical protein